MTNTDHVHWRYSGFNGLVRTISYLFVLILFMSLAFPVFAQTEEETSSAYDPRTEADRIYRRIAGVKPSAEELSQLTRLVLAGDRAAAARLAMQSPTFYNVTLRNLFQQMTNMDQNINAPLNDAVATFIGIVANDLDFREALYGDILFLGDSNQVANLPVYSTQDPGAARNHFRQVENSQLPLNEVLVQQTQSNFSNVGDISGVITTQQWGEYCFLDGTNRRCHQVLLRNFWCTEMEQVADVTMPDTFIRRDVTRAPGGNSSIFKNQCIGCHSLMDGLAGAYAYFDYTDNNGLVYTPGNVQNKMNRNGNAFPEGFRTTDDTWTYMGFSSTDGTFDRFGWAAGGNEMFPSGKGVNSLMRNISSSWGFPSCMAKRSFKALCLRDTNSLDKVLIDHLAQSFVDSGFQFKELMAQTISSCSME